MLKMINKFFINLRNKKVAKIKAKQQAQFKTSMNEVYRTIKWIEKQMPNRKARRQFWADLLHRGFVHSITVERIMGALINRNEVVISREDYNFLQIAKKGTKQA